MSDIDFEHIETRRSGCRLGYQEYDRSRYCYEHGGFVYYGNDDDRCDAEEVGP